MRKRHPRDSRRGFSDPNARVGRDDRGYELGYLAHIAADADSDLPVAYAAASANEKRHDSGLLERAVEVTGGSG